MAMGKVGWFRRVGTGGGGGSDAKRGGGRWRPWKNVRFSPPAAWRLKRSSGAGDTAVERKRRRWWSFLDDVVFRVLSVVEAVVLVAGLCFFFFRFGCQL